MLLTKLQCIWLPPPRTNPTPVLLCVFCSGLYISVRPGTGLFLRLQERARVAAKESKKAVAQLQDLQMKIVSKTSGSGGGGGGGGDGGGGSSVPLDYARLQAAVSAAKVCLHSE